MKYEVPCIEIVRFEFKNILATVSTGGGNPENSDGFNNSEFNGDEDLSFDPFA